MGLQFNQMIERPKENVMIVDALNLAFRYKHSKIRNFYSHYISTVESFARSYKCGTVIIACDKGSSSFRKDIHPTYKQGRKDKLESLTETEKEEAALFFEDFEECIVQLAQKYPLLRFPGVEADDIAAYLADTLEYDKLWLISSDKDWDLLVRPKVSRFSYVTRKEVTVENWKETYPIPMDRYLSYKCLTGDAGDSVEGVEGIGPKRATDLIEMYGDVQSLIYLLPVEGKYKYIKALNSSKELLERNIKLMDLRRYCCDAIGIDNIAKIKEILDEH